ncbi:MAG: helix-turn-helix domain-containing protein [Planctomycetia bacterium]|nr:helix-turn-helix domain-containing protein [Planctomycetia bacterium]
MTQEERMREFITMKELMEMLKVSRNTAYRYVTTWKVRIFRDGRTVRFDKEDVIKAIERKTMHF